MTDPTHARTRGGPVVDTGYGPVRGTDDGAVRRWLGIRYAAAPTGELRWRSPQPPARNQEVADATVPGPVCPQLTDPRIPLDLGGRQGEDSLVLNVWAPGGTEPGAGKPVMVWVHGGAYVLGSGSQPLYDGSVLAVEGDAVVVTVNYRLGPFGFLDLSEFNGQPGARGLRFDTNVGLRDVLFALQWVRDNIAAFGGDPRRVTLFGESAGGGIITTLLASPAAEGLFSAAIAQSSPATSVYDAQRSRAVAHQFLERLGGMARDIGFRMPTLWFAEGHSAVASVYLYRFDFTTPMLRLLRLGAAHATELPYVWGNLVAGPKDPTFKLGGLKHGRAVSERMRRRWVNFAASGQPSGAPGEAVWRPYRREDRATLLIDKQDKTVADLDRDLHATWGSQILSFR
ncbi:carboxylesterase/lipase family protein [Mycolicibacterium fortuitum]|uniref:carboxylesterase/lipase family protein n=1 Tax=Mycolicibacterium fortuitum TaxID=1766 RepID=UPI00261799B3|nr:carboxylesterase family protein [Mycolicibacterium fortuitum]